MRFVPSPARLLFFLLFSLAPKRLPPGLDSPLPPGRHCAFPRRTPPATSGGDVWPHRPVPSSGRFVRSLCPVVLSGHFVRSPILEAPLPYARSTLRSSPRVCRRALPARFMAPRTTPPDPGREVPAPPGAAPPFAGEMDDARRGFPGPGLRPGASCASGGGTRGAHSSWPRRVDAPPLCPAGHAGACRSRYPRGGTQFSFLLRGTQPAAHLLSFRRDRGRGVGPGSAQSPVPGAPPRRPGLFPGRQRASEASRREPRSTSGSGGDLAPLRPGGRHPPA